MLSLILNADELCTLLTLLHCYSMIVCVHHLGASYYKRRSRGTAVLGTALKGTATWVNGAEEMVAARVDVRALAIDR